MTSKEFMELPPRRLQDLTGIHESAWCRWLSGRVSPTLDRLEAAAIALDMPVNELVGAFVERRAAEQAKRELVGV